MKSLKAEKEILKNSKILQFLPFIDQQGLIRAQGRIGKSQLNFETKHPILLHWKHRVVESFLGNEHKNSHHEGTELVRNIVQRKFWILGIRNALRSIKNKCIRCRKGIAQTKAPVMADLPEERLVASTVFSNVGVDYFGPFTIKIGRRNKKRWCCLFTFFTVRAVHIELYQTQTLIVVWMQLCDSLLEEANRSKWLAITGQTSLELKKNWQSI